MQQKFLEEVKESIKNKKYRQALGQLTKLSIEFSHEKNYLICLAEVQRKLNDQEGLLRTYRVLAHLDTEDRALYQSFVIQTLYTLNRKNEALDVAYDFLNQSSERLLKIKVLLTLTKIYIEECDFEGVEEALDELSLLKCEDDFTWWAAGVVELHKKNLDTALTYFRKSIQANPGHDYAWVSLSMLHYEMGDRDLAYANLERALDLNPLNAVALKFYAIWNAKDAIKQEKALERVRFYLSRHSFDEDMSLCFVKILCQSKRWGEAEFELEKLIMTHPQNEHYFRLKNSLQNLQLSC